MQQNKKFIAPGGWFSLTYPTSWYEFEDVEDSFLFYNPDEWTGNFRISAFKGNKGYGDECVEMELQNSVDVHKVKIGPWHCAASMEIIEENGELYQMYVWVLGADDLAIECSFTVPQGASTAEAEAIIASIEVRKEGVKYPAELIPARVSEIYLIDRAYEWMNYTVREEFKVDFHGAEEDIVYMQKMVDSGYIPLKKKELWLNVGIVLCAILTNEVEGWEWKTLVDGNREAPVLQHRVSGKCVDPMKLVWSKVKAGEPVILDEAYQSALDLC
ncbi:hypothetical protein EVA_06207 [gut metagenome]|uniref:DUF3805 domain-containing protein n=1 Tax=gut metagenome TaxID=749906 RepID=J9GEC0_9ZZZZ